MKKEILSQLLEKFPGVQESILGRVADKIGKTAGTPEQVATAIEGVTFQSILETYGDSRANEAQQSAVRNYEAKYGLKDGQKVPDGGSPSGEKKEPGQTPKAEDTAPEWARSLLESNKKLSERLAAIEGERTTATRRQKLDDIIGRLPEALRKPYERTQVDNLTDEQFETLQSEITTEVEGILQDNKSRGAVFGRPVHNVGKQSQKGAREASDAEVDDVVGRMHI